jgi:GntR family transcriptional regulator
MYDVYTFLTPCAELSGTPTVEDLKMSTDTPSRRSLYVLAYDHLKSLIEEKSLQPGDPFPPEPELARQLAISRSTLRRALNMLEREGLIIRKQGVGTFVSDRQQLESGLERLESILTLASRSGVETRCEDLEMQSVEAEAAVAEALDVAEGAPLLCVKRAILFSDSPVAYFEDFVLPDCLGEEEITPGVFSGSVLDHLRHHCPRGVSRALAEITSIPASSSLAQVLQLQGGAAIVLIKETVYDVEGRPIDYSRNYFVPDKFTFRVIRS